jgi:hypothetical protein
MIAGSRCLAASKTGAPCQARAKAGTSFCAFHDPRATAEQDEARRAGGRSRSAPRAVLPAEEADLVLEGPRDLPALLADTINRVRKGALDPRVANTVGYLAGVLIRAFEVSELEERIRRLEGASGGARDGLGDPSTTPFVLQPHTEAP